RIAMLVQSVPEGECHSKIPLSADAPIELQILGPVAISQPHKIRMPLNAIAHLDQPVFLIHQPYEPLARRYEFQRPLALLIEFYRVFDGFWRLDQRRSAVARRAFSHAQQFGNRLLRGFHRLPRELLIEAVRRLGLPRFPTLRAEFDGEKPAIPSQNLAER